ncbi:hypothetical protein OV208_20870 [Corallococcus sp. bb12-1]|uniref:hypothetical protein n=1 Tax=Corallococcus sp. bb12-1 TaxID=2996784 RepID=UPI00226D5EE9|nr:hypothetical protein [Corallococcus sp. bb12-1]MCY1043785.1 hypothetical protein [Corallococcus sp. bb12-1]
MKTTIAEVPAEVVLGFLEDRLAAVDVFFPEVADVRTFQTLMRDLLTRKYGDPMRTFDVARQVTEGNVPVRFAAGLCPVQEEAALADASTAEISLSAWGKFRVLHRGTNIESQVSLTKWALPGKVVMSLQYESSRYASRRAGLIGRSSQKAHEEMVEDL